MERNYELPKDLNFPKDFKVNNAKNLSNEEITELIQIFQESDGAVSNGDTLIDLRMGRFITVYKAIAEVDLADFKD